MLDALFLAIEPLKPLMTSLAVLIARPLGMIVLFPVFARLQIGRAVRTGLAIALILPIFELLHAERLDVARLAKEDAVVSTAATLTLLGMKEFAVGFLLAVFLSVPFWAIGLAGELIDLQRGVTISPIEDPASRELASTTNVLLTIVAIVVFVAAGGFQITAGVFYESYRVWPLGAFLPPFSEAGFLALGGILDHLFRFALLLAGPFVILFLVTDVAVALVERFSPKISSFALSPVVKNLVFTGLLILYGSFVVRYLADEVAATRGAAELLKSLLAVP